MDKFNQTLSNIGNNPEQESGAEECPCKDTDSDIGTSGTINPEESQEELITIHVGAGIKIVLPLTVAMVIAKAISDESPTQE